jgi:hypothetical protein
LITTIFPCSSAWIEEANIKPYELFKSQLIKTSKSNAFKEAVDAIEQYIANPEVSFCWPVWFFELENWFLGRNSRHKRRPRIAVMLETPTPTLTSC